ncbi:glycosyltransferase 87 family protein [Amycolatopsis sp. NPDC059021]|uniref:glycosyltransferase 87 family protein n=1 Tax=Amycolatopsis sp. NPDC059021 TaxID=3346704 RepID=UPI0036730E70
MDSDVVVPFRGRGDPATLGGALRRRLEELGTRRWAVVTLIVAASVVAAGNIAIVCTLWPVDLEVYRFGAQALVQGRDVYGPLPPTRGGLQLPFIYPPFAAVLFLVFLVPPIPVAAVLMLGISLAALGAVVYVVVRPRTSRRTAVVAAVLTATVAPAFEPVRNTLWFGQVNLVLMALVAIDCLAPKTRWPRGLMLGLAAAVKITPAGFVLFFLLKRDFRAAGTAVVTFLAAGLAAFAVAPRASSEYWFGGQLTTASGLSGSVYATNQTIQGAVHRLGLSPAPALIAIVVATLTALVLAAGAMHRADAPMALLLNAAAVLVCSPISWSHHWVWIVPAAVVLGARVRSRRAVAGLVAVLVVFAVAPHSFLPATQLRELSWQPLEHVAGNSYLLLAMGFLAWQCVAPSRSQEPAPG